MARTAQQAEQERSEDLCAALVASVAGARFRRTDTGGRQMHDFDLVFDDATTEAVEVCSFSDSTVREQWSVLERLDEQAGEITASWTVTVTRGVLVRHLAALADPHLAVFEGHGRTSFDAAEHIRLASEGAPQELIRASDSLKRLGIVFAVRAPDEAPNEPPRVIIAAGVEGVGTSRLINQAVQHVAFKRDNRLKLQAAKAARRRHIVVPIDPSAGPVWSLVRQPLATAPPRLPSAVNVAWVIGANGCTLRSELPNAWEPVDIAPSVWQRPEDFRV